MEDRLSMLIVLGLSWIVYTCFGPSQHFTMAQEENYHMVECVLPHYFLCHNGNCLPESHICDGENDCADGSDEDTTMCAQLSCNSTTEFKCASGRCVPKASRCDRVPQCRDRSDEADCVYPPCPTGKFACANNSQCLDMSEMCDGSIDCKDGLASDELHPDPCPANVTCPHYAFKCTNVNVCALPNWMCDGENDCGDNSDEDRVNCKNFKCPEDWFRCADDRCIPMSNVCNGVIDCKDGTASDERHPYPCPKNVTCPDEFFSCEETNICAHPHWLCDGADDCGDKSDENLERCASTPCPEDWFRCKSQRCIPPSWRCDGSSDCPTSEDEAECEAYFQSLHKEMYGENVTVVTNNNNNNDTDETDESTDKDEISEEMYNNTNKNDSISKKSIQSTDKSTSKLGDATNNSKQEHKHKLNPISLNSQQQTSSQSKSNKPTTTTRRR